MRLGRLDTTGERSDDSMFKRISAFLTALGVVVMSPIMAHAQPVTLDLPTSVDLSGLFPYAAAIVTALVGLIVIRKAIKLTNRS